MDSKRVANCVASSAPEQAQKSRAVTKLNGLKTNTMGVSIKFPNRRSGVRASPAPPFNSLI
jgi:hypothetical protein